MNVDDILAQLAADADCSVDLTELALRLASDEYPFLDVDAYLGEIDGLAHEARPYLGSSLTAHVQGLARFLFHEVGFHGNQKNYYDPRNSYLNEVLDRHTGIPITLSLLTMAVGSRLGLSIAGVGLPGHFIVMARANGETLLFDPFHDGRTIQPADCETMVRQATGMPLDVTAGDLEPASASAIVVRMLTNLKGCYLRAADFRRAARVIRRIIQVVPNDWVQHRDLGACLLQGGQPGKAIDPLEAYLAHTPEALDGEAVKKLVRKAQGEVARWN